jgi:hypothetical protein
MNLTISLKSALVGKYGDAGFASIDEALASYPRSAGNDSLVVYLDDGASMQQVGLTPVLALNVGGLTLGIRKIRRELAMEKPSDSDSLFIIGGNSIVPYWQFQNPVQDRQVDRDAIVYSDNPYGALNDALYGEDTQDGYLNPSLPVGRLADAAKGTAADFVKLINAVTKNHQQIRQRNGSAAVYNAQWQKQTDSVAELLSPPLNTHAVPGYQVTSGNRSDLDRKYLYFNLHGFADESAWKGFNPVNGQFYSAVTPDSFDQAFVSGTVVYAENCYGAWTLGKNSSNSCAMRLLDQGAAAVVGATGLAFGSYISPGMLLENADALAQLFFQNSGGMSSGLALMKARRDFLLNDRISANNVFVQKTLLQFTLLGDPTLA